LKESLARVDGQLQEGREGSGRLERQTRRAAPYARAHATITSSRNQQTGSGSALAEINVDAGARFSFAAWSSARAWFRIATTSKKNRFRVTGDV
jgi:hypothetical protein